MGFYNSLTKEYVICMEFHIENLNNGGDTASSIWVILVYTVFKRWIESYHEYLMVYWLLQLKYILTGLQEIDWML